MTKKFIVISSVVAVVVVALDAAAAYTLGKRAGAKASGRLPATDATSKKPAEQTAAAEN